MQHQIIIEGRQFDAREIGKVLDNALDMANISDEQLSQTQAKAIAEHLTRIMFYQTHQVRARVVSEGIEVGFYTSKNVFFAYSIYQPHQYRQARKYAEALNDNYVFRLEAELLSEQIDKAFDKST